MIFTGKITIRFEFLASLIFALAFFSNVFSQVQKPSEPKIEITIPQRTAKPKWKSANKIRNESDTPVEKSVSVNPNINISLCVSDGNLKINGWNRNEIRVFVSEGSQAGFTFIEKGWIKVLGFDPSTNKDNNPDECLSGDSIEIDVPRGAIVNVKSNVSEINVNSVAKVTIENGGGDIFLNNVERGIDARTYEGDVTVGQSGGAVSLFSTTGNITAFDISPSEIGDIFKAKTSNGAITLKNIGQRQIEVGTNTGSINFSGDFLSGGQYNFGTSNGTISLSIPSNSSLKILASYGYGVFDSEFPLQNVEKNEPSRLRNLSGQIGNGDATLKLTTVSGAIRLKKQ